ncbi:MAG TPA: aldo/keto reductase [Bacteroidota bacterium]|nr:aldo/keto reductase [Bacteroidota bacterium]
MEDFTRMVSLGATGIKVSRLGLSASYRPGVRAIHRAIDSGVNFFFGFGIDTQLSRGLREAFKADRSKYVLATGAYNLVYGHPNLRRSLEKRLRQFKTDYIDVFMFLGVLKPEQLKPAVLEEMVRMREEGKVRSIGMSCHDRKFVGQLASDGALDVMMMRYNAAHRGAEVDIFPYLADHNPGIVSYTATRWTKLIRKTKGWPKNEAIPDAPMCYRFVLSNPAVHVCLTAPANEEQLKQNLEVLSAGPLPDDEMNFVKRYGDAVYSRKQWFM